MLAVVSVERSVGLKYLRAIPITPPPFVYRREFVTAVMHQGGSFVFVPFVMPTGRPIF